MTYLMMTTLKTRFLKVLMRLALKTTSISMLEMQSPQQIMMTPTHHCHRKLNHVLNKSKGMWLHQWHLKQHKKTAWMKKNDSKKNKTNVNLNVLWKWSTWKPSFQMHFGTLSASSSKKRKKNNMKHIVSFCLIGWQRTMFHIPLLRTQQFVAKDWKSSSSLSFITTWHRLYTSAWGQPSPKIVTQLNLMLWSASFSTYLVSFSLVWLFRQLSGATGPLMRNLKAKKKKSQVKFHLLISVRSSQVEASDSRNAYVTHH